MLSLSVAARFLRSSLGQTSLIIAGIGVGIAVLIFVGSLITSLQADLIDATVGSRPHITLLGEDGEPVSASLAETARAEPEVTTAIPVRRLSAIFVKGDDSSALSVTGGTASDLDSIYTLSEGIVEGEISLDTSEILIGTDFSDISSVGVGEQLDLILPDGTMGEFVVAGIFDLGSSAANERLAFLDPVAASTALGQSDDEFSAIEIQVDDVFVSSDVAERLATDSVVAVDWQAENEELLSGLAAQSGSSILIQAFVLIAVALGIASTLAISAAQKTRQIGILKAMGMTDGAAGRIFLLQAAILGTAGVAAGIGLGYLLIWGFSFAPVDFSVSPSPSLIAVAAVIGVLVALLSSIVPSRSTSRLDPIEVIQGG
ncbi:MAG: FtsX-like permease family protein [Acidimicrobiia bacterium]